MLKLLVIPFLFLFLFLSPLKAGAEPALEGAAVTQEDGAEFVEPVKVSLEARLVRIVLNDENRQGVDWSAIVSDFHEVPLKKEDNPVWADKKYRLNVGIVSHEDYEVLLEALDTVGHMTQSSFPVVDVVLDAQTAIHLGEDAKVMAQLEEFKEEYKVSLEPSLRFFSYENKAAGHVPLLLNLKAQTQLKVEDKQVIVIGGIFNEEEVTRRHKLPLLGDLPIVGLVFRSKGRLMQRSETVIFLKVNKIATDGKAPHEGN